jgi:hypothetical protein
MLAISEARFEKSDVIRAGQWKSSVLQTDLHIAQDFVNRALDLPQARLTCRALVQIARTNDAVRNPEATSVTGGPARQNVTADGVTGQKARESML